MFQVSCSVRQQVINFCRFSLMRRFLPFVAFGGILFCPVLARASCGSHVEIVGESKSQFNQIAQPMHFTGLENRSNHQSIPCTGPSCSRNPGQLPPTPLTTIILIQKKCGAFCLASPFAPQREANRLKILPDDEEGVNRSSPAVPPPR